jgi:hypothetical protein
MEQAYILVDITDQHCPQASEQWESSVADLRTDLERVDARTVEQTLETVWAVMAEQRHSSGAFASLPASPRTATPPQSVHAEEWSAVLDALQKDVPYSDWRSWLAPLELLELDRDTAIIGAPNVFVRNEVSAKYTPSIADALRATFGRDLKVEVAIGTMVLG